jgi:hypothetical protein
MEKQIKRHSTDNAAIVFGLVLVLTGLVFLAAQLVPLNLDKYSWPLFVIVPGVAMAAAGIAWKQASGLVIAGSIVTAVGLVLAVQNMFALWASWSYAWALVAPGAVGVGIAIQGLVRDDRQQVQRGISTMAVGLALFAAFGGFFEGVPHVDNIDLGPLGNVILPLVLIAIGIVVLAMRTFGAGRAEAA